MVIKILNLPSTLLVIATVCAQSNADTFVESDISISTIVVSIDRDVRDSFSHNN